MSGVLSSVNVIKTNYWSLIKSRQTFLLTLTGITGYLCLPRRPIDWLECLGLVISLLLTISGCTVLNMLIDRDIDRKMSRTRMRPLATGQVGAQPALILGLALNLVGLSCSVWLSKAYFGVVLAGAVINVVVYSLWLKRLTAWSILFGGIAGGTPILAGRVLSIGHVDSLGMLLALIIVFWIPAHNLTLDMLYTQDYINAKIPTAVNVYGVQISYLIIAMSNIFVGSLAIITSYLLGVHGVLLAVVISASLAMVILSIYAWVTNEKSNPTVLYKYVSMYLLGLMLILALSGIL